MKTDKLDDSCTKSYDQKMQIMQNIRVGPYLQNVIIKDQKMPHFHFCGNNRKIDDQGCTNVGIIKNFLSIQIQEQEQEEARSMCFQTWSNNKKIAFKSSCKKIAVKIRRKKTKSLISLPYIFLHYISGQQCKQCKQRIARCYIHL